MYQIAGWLIKLCFPVHLAECWKAIACICAHVQTYPTSLTWNFLVPVLLCFFFLISSPPRGLFRFTSFSFFFFFFCCGWKSSRLSQLPGLWLTTARSLDASVADRAPQHNTGEPWDLCSLWVELQLWADEQHVVKQPPPLLSACYSTVRCLLPEEAQVKSQRGNKAENMDLFFFLVIDSRRELW